MLCIKIQNMDEIKSLVGKKYVFEDGDKIEIIQVKSRNDEEHLITVHVTQGPGIPRKLVFTVPEFTEHYGHLFGLVEDIEPKE